MLRKIIIIIAIILFVAGLGFVLFPPVSNFVGTQISKGETEKFDCLTENVVTVEQAQKEGKGTTFEEAYENKEVDAEGYPIDKNGNRTGNTPVVYQRDLDRLLQDSIAYNENLKTEQGTKFVEGVTYYAPALKLSDYGIFDGIYGYISAPTINLTLPIYLGTSDANMSYGAAHMTNTSLPLGGENTNSVAAGHTGYVGRIFFDNIRNLKYGDKVYVKNFWETLTYEVVETYTCRPDESQGLFIQDGRDLFTMFTCTPDGNGGFDRYLVVCERVD